MGSGTDSLGSKASNNTNAATPQATKDLVDMAKQFASETKDLRGTLISQMSELLKTGGSQAQVPLVAQALERSKRATSQAVSSLEGELARSGLAGTPFGAMAKGQTRLSGNLETAAIPTQIAQAFIQQVPGFVLGQGQNAVGGLGTASTNQTQLTSTMMNILGKSLNLGK